MSKIKKGDNVVVIAGRDKGKRGDVSRIVDANHVIVNGINTVKKHTRPNPMRSRPAADSMRRPNSSSISTPNTSASRPSSTETVTWPNPQSAVTLAVRHADHRSARAIAANGTQ